jgi:hypothetical protein
LSFNLVGEITFQDKNKLKRFTSMKPELPRIVKGIIHDEKEEKQPQT